MSTTLYLHSVFGDRGDVVADRWTNGSLLDGLTWFLVDLHTARASSAYDTSVTCPDGPVDVVPVSYGGSPSLFVSAPLAADVTVAGTISFNFWAYEASMGNNATIGALVYRLQPDGTATEILRVVKGTELGTSFAAQTFSGSPTSTTFHRGDRIGVMGYFDDATGVTMAAGTLHFSSGASSAGAQGDSYLTFTETFSVESAPAGTTIYPTSTASSVDSGTGYDEFEVWTSRGSGVTTKQSTVRGGPADPFQLVAPLNTVSSGAVLANNKWDFGRTTTYQKIAQSFTPGASGPIVVRWAIGKTAGTFTDDPVLELQSDNSGVPSGTVLTTLEQAVGISSAQDDFTQRWVSSEYEVTSGVKYWLVARRSGSLSDTTYYYWMRGSSSYASHTASFYDGSNWTDEGSGNDACFTVIVGHHLEWFSVPLEAFTLAGVVLANVRAISSISITSIRVQIARTDNDGTNATVWGWGGWAWAAGTSEAIWQFWISGDDLAFSQGQRLRIRIYTDDTFGWYGGGNISTYTGRTLDLKYAGTSGGASGDTYFTFPVTLVEYTGGASQKFGNFKLDASIYYPGKPGLFTVNAWVISPGTGFKNLDAIKRQIQAPTGFTLDAQKKLVVVGGLGLNAVIKASVIVGHGEFLQTVDEGETSGDEYTWAGQALSRSDQAVAPTYAFAWLGSYILSGTTFPTRSFLVFGQYIQQFVTQYQYGIYEGFVSFDTREIPGNATILEAVFSVYAPSGPNEGNTSQSQLRSHDWLGTPTWSPMPGTFVPGSLFGDHTLRATLEPEEQDYPPPVSDDWVPFDDVALAAGIRKAAPTRFVLTSANTVAGDPPEYVLGDFNQNVQASYPRLYVRWEAGTPLLLDAWIIKQPTVSFGLNAVIYKPNIAGPPFTLDAWKGGSVEASFAADAVLMRVTSGGTALDAIRAQVGEGSSTVGAFVQPYFRLDAVVASNAEEKLGNFNVDAVVLRLGMAGAPFAMDALKLQSFPGTTTLDALRLAPVPGGALTDAVIQGPRTAGSPLDALLLREMPQGMAVDAWKAATIAGGATLDANIYGPIIGGTTVNADIKRFDTLRSFALDAAFVPLRSFLEAIIGQEGRDLFWLNAVIVPVPAPSPYPVDGSIQFLFAVIHASRPYGFGLNAWIQLVAGTQLGATTLDANIFGPGAGGFRLNAYIVRPETEREGLAYLEAWIAGPYAGSGTLDAVIIGLTREGGFTVAADIMKAGEQRGTGSLDAVISQHVGDAFWLNAEILRDAFLLSAWVAHYGTLDAFIVGTVGSGFGLDAWLTKGTLDAVILKPWAKTASLDAFIGFPGGVPVFGLDAVKIKPAQTSQLWLEAAVIADTAPSSFALDAFIGRQFGLSAWIATARGGLGGFGIDAYLRGADIVIYPDPDSSITLTSTALVGDLSLHVSATPAASVTYVITVDDEKMLVTSVNGTILTVVRGYDGTVPAEHAVGTPITYAPGPVDGQGNPVAPGYATSRAYRVKVTVAGTEVTGDVVWAEAEFKQQARTGPGTFSITLLGAYDFHGGEEIVLTINDLREFGGYVLSITYGYVFDAVDQPTTILRGVDYNILLDRLVVYNKDQPARYGPYTSWKPFAQETLDSTIIHKVFSSYVDLPAGFDYETFVDTIDTAAPETPWSMPQAGSPIRQVMQSISQVTNGIFWIDAYKALHYHARSTITAPAPITDSEGGITGQQISLQTDISKMITDARLWGTLARRVQGDLMMTHHWDHDDEYGLWQHGEWRSEIHHGKWLSRRAGSIISRYSLPIQRAKVTIFDPGYAAGQVVPVILNEYGVDADLPIRELHLTFATSKGPQGGIYYATPRYELTIGIDPEDPWDIYDFLPFEAWNVGQNEKAVGQRRFWGVGPVDPAKIIWDTFDNRSSSPNSVPLQRYGLGLGDLPPDDVSWGLLSSWDYYNWEWWFGSYWFAFLRSFPYDNAWVENGQGVLMSLHVEDDAFSAIGPDDHFGAPVAVTVGAPPSDGGFRGNDEIGHQDFEVEVLYSFDNVKPGERQFNWGQAMILEVVANGIMNSSGGLEGDWNAYAIFPNQGVPGDTFNDDTFDGFMGTPGGKWHAKWKSGVRPGKTPGYHDTGPEWYENKVKHWKDGTPEPLEWVDIEANGVPDDWWRSDSWSLTLRDAMSIWPHAYAQTFDNMGWYPNYMFRVRLYHYPPEPNVQASPDYVPPQMVDINNYPPSILRIDWIKFGDQSHYTLGGYVTDGWGAEVVDVVDGTFVTSAAPGRGTLSVYDTEAGELLDPTTDWETDPADPDGMHYRLLRGLNPPYVTCAYRVAAQGLRTTHMTTRVNVQNVDQDRLRLLDIHGV